MDLICWDPVKRWFSNIPRYVTSGKEGSGHHRE